MKLSLVAVLLSLEIAGRVHAQAPLGAEMERLELDLRDVRFDNLRQRRSEGWTLVLGGLVSTLGGIAAAVALHDREAWLAGGVTTASFGVINTLLGIGLLDVGASRRRAVIEERVFSYSHYRSIRERELRAQRSAARTFGVNFGLDILYMAAGALMVGLGRGKDGKRWLSGAGIAMFSQSAFLLCFDLAGLIRARHRARAVEALPLVESARP